MSTETPKWYTPVNEVPSVVKRCRDGYNSGLTRPLEQRKGFMRSILRMLDEHEEEFCKAVHADLRKHPQETKLCDIAPVRMEGYYLLDHMDAYAAPEKADTEGLFKLEDCTIRREPLGVVLIVSPWNYPLQLTLLPLLGAIAAGNTVVMKPSELAPSTASLLQEVMPKYIPPEIVGFVNGGVAETTRLLAERFDHILYTGNSRVATIVMTAAAKHLTPVTLELGGKSPVFVDASCKKNLAVVAKRIMWGKVLNAGQVCVSPDYVFVHESLKVDFVEALKTARLELLGSNPLEREDYVSIVNKINFNRIKGLMNGGNMLFGGECDESKLLIAPTVFENVPLDHPLMTDEIFGPLLPILTFKEIDEAIEFVNNREKPLALYMFSNDDTSISNVLNRTSSGGVSVNDVIMHVSVPYLPFGGVGKSGMGQYHGKYSFHTFSHQKSVLRRNMGMEFANELRYPPYTEEKLKRFRSLLEPNTERSALRRGMWNLFSPVAFLCTFAGDLTKPRKK